MSDAARQLRRRSYALRLPGDPTAAVASRRAENARCAISANRRPRAKKRVARPRRAGGLKLRMGDASGANAARIGAMEPPRFVAGREVPHVEGCPRARAATAAACGLREPSAPAEPRQFLRSTGRAVRRSLCADWRHGSDAKARSFRATEWMLHAGSPTVERCGG